MSTEEIRKDIIKRVKRIVVKFGSYVLTTRTWQLDRKVFIDLTQTIAAIKKRNVDFILVSSGAIAAGMGKMGLKERPKSIPLEQAAAAIGQINLMGFYEKLFVRLGLHVAQVLLTHRDLKERKSFLNARHTLLTLLAYKVIPIINENDSIVVEEIKFGDNDYLAALVTNLVQADLLIIMSDIDGLYDNDPRRFKDAKLIPLVENIDAGIEKLSLGTKTQVGRGGMITKIKAAKTAALFGIPTVIANGKIAGNLLKIFQGREIGTLFLPEKNKLTSRKHWIAFTLKSQGSIILDDGAKKAVLEKGKSILPSGILDVCGVFEPGEAVSCCDQNGVEFAKGLVSYGSLDVAKIKGLKTSQIKETLGDIKFHEVMHRNNLITFKH